MISSDLKLSLMASEFMKLLGCINMSKNFTAMSSLLLKGFRLALMLLLALFPITGAIITGLLRLPDKGLLEEFSIFEKELEEEEVEAPLR